MNRISCLVVTSIVLSLVALIPIKGKALAITGTPCGDIIEVVSPSYPVSFAVHGLAFDGKNLWAAEVDEFNSKVHKLGFDEDTGAMIIEESYDALNWASGITFVGKILYSASFDPPKISKFQTKGKKAGEIKSTFDGPGWDCTGLAFDGEYVYNSDFGGGVPGGEVFPPAIHRIEINGDLVESFPPPGSSPEGLTFDGEFLWNVDWDLSKIYKLDPVDLSIFCEWQWGTFPDTHPIGLTFDGNFLWLSDESNHTIYKLIYTPVD